MTYEELAEAILFRKMKHSELLEHFRYRRNKEREHLNRAIKSGLKAGCGKVENEIDHVARTLRKVLEERVCQKNKEAEYND